jgi:activator of 2-hydroxyglutaryl-CoA dehydratase
MHGALVSLVDRSVQLMKRVQMQPEVTLAGGILRFEKMARIIREKLETQVNLPEGDLVQFVGSFGAAALGLYRLRKLRESNGVAEMARPGLAA